MPRRLIYVDVNVLYYFFTAHPQFGEGSRELLKRYQVRLTSLRLETYGEKGRPRDAAAHLPLDAEILAKAL